MKNLILLVLLSSSIFNGMAQLPYFAFSNVLSGNHSYAYTCSDVDISGNHYLAGRFDNAIDLLPELEGGEYSPEGFSSIFVQKVNPAGVPTLNLVFHSDVQIQTTAIAADEDENIYIMGNHKGTVDFDPGDGVYEMTAFETKRNYFILKLSANGDFLWLRNFNNMVNENKMTMHDIAVDQDYGLFITGSLKGTVDLNLNEGEFAYHSSDQNHDAYLIGMDLEGEHQWAKLIHSDGDLIPRSITIDQQGNVLYSMTGGELISIEDEEGNIEEQVQNTFSVYKYNASALLEWSHTIITATSSSNKHKEIACDLDGNVYVTGHFSNETDFDPEGTMSVIDVGENITSYVYKLSASGDFLWVNTLEDEEELSVYVRAMDVSNDGYLYLAGFYSYESTMSTDAFLSKLDLNGNLIWTEIWGGEFPVYADLVKLTADNSILLTGEFQGHVDVAPGEAVEWIDANTNSLYLLKLSPFGIGIEENSLNTKIYSNPYSNSFSIVLEETHDYLYIELYNSIGQIVAHFEYFDTNTLKVDLPDQMDMYIADIKTDTGSQARVKLMKN